ncbi:hypothetical protein FS749_008663 [Ceratobasidium sp. UAMH 11750]|nr:hypothetical protein FS749_008663 [Ceratobasidium sp. UAMH 11750]
MAMREGDTDWTRNVVQPRLADDGSPGSTATAIQEPDKRPPGTASDHQAPHAGFLLQKHSSHPSPPSGYRSHHSDSRALTDPIGGHHFPLLNQAALAERPQSRPQVSPPLNIAPRPALSTRSNSSESKLSLTKPLLFSPVAKPNIPSPPDRFPQDIWQVDLSAPGAVLFSTGPLMAKSTGTTSEADAGRTSSIDGTLWGTPSGLASSNTASDPTSQDRASNPPSGYAPDSASLVYTTGHPNSNVNPHAPAYPSGYPSYNPNSPYGASSPRHSGFGGTSIGGQNAQTNTYPNPGSGHPYASYRPSMPYGAYPSYQNASGYNQYHGSPMGGTYSGFPAPGAGYSSSSPAAGGYPSSPPVNAYQGSPAAGGYPSPTSAYGMHFAPYGMVSAPPMYAPTTYAHAPYGHPYLPQQGQPDEGQGSGMWWFMPAGSGSTGYGAQPQAQYGQRFGNSQQPPPHQSQPALLNSTSPHMQQLSIPSFSPHPAVHSPTAHALSPTASTSALSPSSPRQMYAAFSGMSFQPPGVASPPSVGRYPPPLSLPTSGQHPSLTSPVAPSSPSALSPTRPLSSSKGGRASTTSKAAGTGSRVTSPATTRRPWHPNPPVARSEWVMWVGNVPSDATHDELWTFFNQDTTAREPSAATGSGRTLLPPAPVGPAEATGGSNAEPSHGVSSVFLISRSNCAFVNYEEEVYLSRAVSFFNGRPLRPHDPRCPRLVCRVRRKDDDLRAGVGGQRGIGLHARWIQEQEHRAGEDGKKDEAGQDDPATSPSTYLGPASSSGSSPPVLAPADDIQKLPADVAGTVTALRDSTAAHHSGSASTNSSLLARNFPKRYFILKSLTQFDLNISVDRGLWATQAHNEPTLDRAFRTSKDVFLIFSANKSGEWFGYARMEGPIINNQQLVNWESRVSPRSPSSPTAQRKSEGAAPSEESSTTATQPGEAQHLQAQPIFSPSEHKFAASPAPITPSEALKLQAAAGTPASPSSLQPPRTDGLVSAPPELGEAHRQLTNPARDANEAESFDRIRPSRAAVVIAKSSEPFELDMTAPYRAAREMLGPSKQQESHVDGDGIVHKDTALTTDELERARNLSGDQPPRPIRESLASVEASLSVAPAAGEEKTEGWGKPFKIKWIRTEKLPFHRTRHLRNPWNNDREVKVSRDGTEVEPSIGQKLIEEWDRVVEQEAAAAAPSTSRHVLPSRPGMHSTFGSAPQPSKPSPRGHSQRQP